MRQENLATSSAGPHLLMSQEATSSLNLKLTKRSAGVGLQETSSSSMSSKMQVRSSSPYIHFKELRFLRNVRFRAFKALAGLDGDDGVAGVPGSSTGPVPCRENNGEGAFSLSSPVLALDVVSFSEKRPAFLAFGDEGDDGLEGSAMVGKVGTDACFVSRAPLLALFGLLGLLPPNENLPAGEVLAELLFLSPAGTGHKLFQKPSRDSAPALR